MARIQLQHVFIAVAIATAHALEASGGNAQKPVTGAHSISSSPFNEDFGKFVRESLDIWHVPGMSVGVIDGDDGYGYAIIPDVPATADTLWYGCSTTKAQAAALLSHLINSENYSSAFPQDWETPMAYIIRDDFVMQDEWATAHITLNDVVSHRSGLGRHDYGLQRIRDGKQLRPRDVTRNLRNLAMKTEPRVQWSYCNYMYIALGHVVETVTGQWLGHALRENLWAPLGMSSTYFNVDDALAAAPQQHLAAGYVWNEAAGNYTLVDYMALTDFSAAGAVISTVKDYAKWISCLINKSTPLSQKTHLDLQKPRMFLDEDGGATGDKMAATLYGLGWLRTTIHGKTVYFHPGGMHAYGAEVFWLPDVKFGVVTFGNTVVSSNWQQLDVVYRLIEDKLGIAADERINIREMQVPPLPSSMKSWDSVMTREKAIDTFFSDRPEPPLPSTFSMSQLVGSYTNKGWGDVTFTEEYDLVTGKPILVGPRPHAVFRHTFVLERTTGDYWLVKVTTDGESPLATRFFTARFVAGVGGEPVAMDLDTAQGPGDAGDGVITFTRTEYSTEDSNSRGR